MNDLSEKSQMFPAQVKGSMPVGLRPYLFTVDEQPGEQVSEQQSVWNKPKFMTN